MKIGLCTNPESLSALQNAKQLGYSYFESALSRFAELSEEQLRTVEENMAESKLPCLAVNGFFPGRIRLVGEDIDYPAIEDYVYSALALAPRIGFRVAVFGSGGSRRIPEGFARERAYEQLERLCADIIAPAAKRSGVIVAVEELNSKECNILNTCAETVELIRRVNRPEIRLLIDFYHVGVEGEPFESLADMREYIAHTHIASPTNNRAFPSPGDGTDYAKCFAALTAAGYNGLMSIEGDARRDLAGSSAKAFEVFAPYID